MAEGASPVLTEVPADNELQLQDRLKQHPELVPVDEFGLAGPMLVVGRETVFASGAADLIGVDQRGEIIIVEFKTGPQNPDFRSALSQLTDYGSHLWNRSYDEFDAIATNYFTGRHCPPDSPTKGQPSLVDAANTIWGDAWDVELKALFREGVEQALATGRFHFVVAAQRFTPAMERTATYLNAVTSAPSFYLVEIIRFSNDAVDAFEARTILKPGPTATRTASPGRLDRTAFLDRFEDGSEYRAAIAELIDFCSSSGVIVNFGISGVSLRLPTNGTSGPFSIGWVFPPGVSGIWGLRNVSFGIDAKTRASRPEEVEPAASFVADVGALAGAEETTSDHVDGWTFAPEAFTAQHEAVRQALEDLLAASAEGTA